VVISEVFRSIDEGKAAVPELHMLAVNLPNVHKVKAWPPRIRLTRQAAAQLVTRYSSSAEEFWASQQRECKAVPISVFPATLAVPPVPQPSPGDLMTDVQAVCEEGSVSVCPIAAFPVLGPRPTTEAIIALRTWSIFSHV
jgi:hypothetical protein